MKNDLAGPVRPYFGGASNHCLRPGRLTRLSAVTRPATAESQAGPRGCLAAVAAAEGWLLDDSRPQYELIVPVASERSQSVRVQFDCRDELGRLILVYTSPCGSLSAAKAAMALRHNARRHLLCFAVDKVEQKRLLVLKAIQASDLVTEAGVRELVLLIARDADRVELQLTGRDAY